MATRLAYNVSGIDELFKSVTDFLIGAGDVGTPGYSGTGNGTLDDFLALGDNPSETWTLTATSATNFTVTGSVSGAKAAATVGTPYDNGLIAFTITAGGTPFVASDAFTIAITATALYTEGVHWEKKGTFDVNDPEDGIALMGKGASGTDEIYLNMRKYSDVPSGIYGIGLRAARGYLGTEDYDSQPQSSSQVGIGVWDGAMTYWLFANGRRFILVVNVSTVYLSMYGGLILPYALNAEYNYPMFISAQTSTPAVRWSSEDDNHRGFFQPGEGAAYLNTPENDWLEIKNYNNTSKQTAHTVWPWNSMASVINCIDGSKLALQAQIFSTNGGGNTYGALDNVFWVPGWGATSPEDTLTIGGDTYYVFNDVFRNSNDDFVAIKDE